MIDADKIPLEELKRRYPLPTKEIKREQSPIFKYETGNPSSDSSISVKTEIVVRVIYLDFIELKK